MCILVGEKKLLIILNYQVNQRRMNETFLYRALIMEATNNSNNNFEIIISSYE